MKNAFIAYERHSQDGKLFLDADGCQYLKPHTHVLLAGKEFANQGEAVTVIRDHNIANPTNPFKGELILLNVISF